jgi:hypothetical protein
VLRPQKIWNCRLPVELSRAPPFRRKSNSSHIAHASSQNLKIRGSGDVICDQSHQHECIVRHLECPADTKMNFVIQEPRKGLFTSRHLPVAKAHLAGRFL